MTKALIQLCFVLLLVLQARAQVSTYVGTGTAGNTNGALTTSMLNQPYGIATRGQVVYISEVASNEVRLANSSGLFDYEGNLTAGFLDGQIAMFSGPTMIVFNDAWDLIIADSKNNRIRVVKQGTGLVSTLAGTATAGFADGAAGVAQFNNPTGIAAFGDIVYIGDTGNNRVRKITAAGVVSTIAGSGVVGSADGAGATATFTNIVGLVTDRVGDVYVMDKTRIRKITVATNVVSTLCGTTVGSADGTFATATFTNLMDAAMDLSWNMWVTDGNEIRKITFSPGTVTTVAGADTAGFADGTLAAVVTYYGIFVYHKLPNQSWAAAFSQKPVVLPEHHLGQAESVAFSKDGKTIFALAEGKSPEVIRYNGK